MCYWRRSLAAASPSSFKPSWSTSKLPSFGSPSLSKTLFSTCTASSHPPSVVFVLGGPGVGKGSQCALLTQHYEGIAHLSAGELLRAEVAQGSEEGELIENCITSGTIVPSRITTTLLLREVDRLKDTHQVFLIDGFPRSLENFEGWQTTAGGLTNSNYEMKGCLFFDGPKEIMMERLMKRSQTSGRTDDNLESIEKRFTTFNNDSRVVLSEFQRCGLLQRVDASGGLEEVFHNTRKAMTTLLAPLELLSLSALSQTSKAA